MLMHLKLCCYSKRSSAVLLKSVQVMKADVITLKKRRYTILRKSSTADVTYQYLWLRLLLVQLLWLLLLLYLGIPAGKASKESMTLKHAD